MVKLKKTSEHIWLKANQLECYNCGVWYVKYLKRCPACKTVNWDYFDRFMHRREKNMDKENDVVV